jgi:predicted metal-dependent peptidase
VTRRGGVAAAGQAAPGPGGAGVTSPHDRLAAAKLWLISDPGESRAAVGDLPYLAHALYALVPVLTDDVATAAADDRWRLYVNPGWLGATSIEQVATEVVHLVWHLLQQHPERARDLRVGPGTAAAWRRAADVTVRRTLDDSGLRSHLPTAQALSLPAGRSAEEYYAMLSGLPAVPDDSPEKPHEGAEAPDLPACGSACDGLRRDHEPPTSAETPGLDDFTATEVRRRVAIAYRDHCTARGDEPGELGRWAAQVLEPRISWQPLLAMAVRRAAGWAAGSTDYTYQRPSRRASAVRGVVLPGMRRPLPHVAMVIDTSASIDDVLLGQALGEVDGALRALGVPGESVTVLACDAAVHAVSRVRNARDAEMTGGGGTDLRAGIHAAVGLRPRVGLVVVLTDGYTPWPRVPPPQAPVVAAILGRHGQPLPTTPMWAHRVECLVD